MDIQQYFTPLRKDTISFRQEQYIETTGDRVHAYIEGGEFPEITDSGIAIFGVKEDRSAVNNAGCAEGPDYIRRFLYSLAVPSEKMNLYDFGNIENTETIERTYYAVTQVAYRLMEQGLTVIVLGGSHDLTFPLYQAYEVLGQVINMCVVDSRFDIGESAQPNSRTYLNHIIMQKPNYLFNFTNLGYQSYFVGEPLTKLMEELRFDAYRLGELQDDIFHCESLIRNADFVSMDVSAIRQSDAPGNNNISPHGFFSQEFCQIASYAGLSDKTSCLGIFESNPALDDRGHTSHVLAHALWYFIYSYYMRKHDTPYPGSPIHRTFTVFLDQKSQHDVDQVVFYNSDRTDRWWIEVPCKDDDRRSRYKRHLILPCEKSDYQETMRTGMPPALWWKYYQRLNEL